MRSRPGPWDNPGMPGTPAPHPVRRPPPIRDPRIRANRTSWGHWARIHVTRSPTYPVDRFRRGDVSGRLPLPDDLGPVRGKSLLHLQCHIGTDSLWWAKQGAYVTGVDLTPEAVEEAKKLSRDSGIPARFIESNVYDLPKVLRNERFDIVFTSYGTICWLPDLKRWAKVIARFLKPGGFFYIADTHPILGAIEFDGSRHAPRFARRYFDRRPESYVTGKGTYANPGATHPQGRNFEWQHPVDDIVTSIRSAGLTIESIREFPYTFFEITQWSGKGLMRRDRKGLWHLNRNAGLLPLMFSLTARKPKR
jgi:SAM-dependent methyltransferase